MEKVKFTVLLESMLAVWYLKEVFVEHSVSMYTMLIVLLLYFSLKVAYYLLEDRKNSGLIPLVLSVGIIVIQTVVFTPIAYFFAISIYQGLNTIIKNSGIWAIVLAVGLGFLVDMAYLQNYIVVSALTLLLMATIQHYTTRINRYRVKETDLALKMERLKADANALKDLEGSAKYASQLEERSRIAQKLHDELGHTLSGSTMQLEAISLLVEKEPEKAKTMLKTVIKGLRDGTDEIRKILKAIKPETASINISSIKQLAAQTKEKSGVQTDVIYDSDVSILSRQQWQVVVTNIREALTNMMKHANATRAMIVFDRLNTLFKIKIEDNGKGCLNIEAGLGLSGMAERTEQIGGTLITDGTQGFSVIMLLPIEPDKER